MAGSDEYHTQLTHDTEHLPYSCQETIQGTQVPGPVLPGAQMPAAKAGFGLGISLGFSLLSPESDLNCSIRMI